MKGLSDRPPSLKLLFFLHEKHEYLKSAAYFFHAGIKRVFIAFKVSCGFDVLSKSRIPERFGINELMRFQILNNESFPVFHDLAFRLRLLNLEVLQCWNHAFTRRCHFYSYHDFTGEIEVCQLVEIFAFAELHLCGGEAYGVTRLRRKRGGNQDGTAVDFRAVDFAFELLRA